MTSARILLMRHAEKTGDPMDPHLSQDGYARAAKLADYIPATFGIPRFLIATSISTHSVRPIETLDPLSAKLGISVDATYADQDYGALASQLISESRYADAGTLIVICWHHGNIPALGQALGLKQSDYAFLPEMNGHANPQGNGNKWNAAEFNKFWILDYAAAGGVRFQSVDQQPR